VPQFNLSIHFSLPFLSSLSPPFTLYLILFGDGDDNDDVTTTPPINSPPLPLLGASRLSSTTPCITFGQEKKKERKNRQKQKSHYLTLLVRPAPPSLYSVLRSPTPTPPSFHTRLRAGYPHPLLQPAPKRLGKAAKRTLGYCPLVATETKDTSLPCARRRPDAPQRRDRSVSLLVLLVGVEVTGTDILGHSPLPCHSLGLLTPFPV
jgi:hypothetical protein